MIWFHSLKRTWRCWRQRHDDGWYRVTDNPPYYDEQGGWHPPQIVEKCKYCHQTREL